MRTRLTEAIPLVSSTGAPWAQISKCLLGLTKVCFDWPGAAGKDIQLHFATALWVSCIQVGRRPLQFSVLHGQCADEIINLKRHTFCGSTAEISWANLKAALWSTNTRMLLVFDGNGCLMKYNCAPKMVLFFPGAMWRLCSMRPQQSIWLLYFWLLLHIASITYLLLGWIVVLYSHFRILHNNRE